MNRRMALKQAGVNAKRKAVAKHEREYGAFNAAQRGPEALLEWLEKNEPGYRMLPQLREYVHQNAATRH